MMKSPPNIVCDASFENSYDSTKFGKRLTIKSELTAASSTIRPKTAINFMKMQKHLYNDTMNSRSYPLQKSNSFKPQKRTMVKVEYPKACFTPTKLKGSLKY